MSEIRRKRFLVHGANALLASVASIGIAVVGYILVDRYRPFRIDLTDSGLYELSPRTLEILEELPGDISIVYFERPPSEEAGFLNSRVSELLEEYRVRSGGKITYEIKNPFRDPLEMEELGVTHTHAVVRRGEEKVIVKETDLFEQKMAEMSMDGPQLDFTGEQAFSSALLRLVEGGTSVACFLTGHGEISPDSEQGTGYSELALALKRSNLTTRTTELTAMGGTAPAPKGLELDKPLTAVDMKVEVPADCSVLIIAGASRGRFSDAEIDAVQRHSESGRGVVLLVESFVEVRAEELAKRFGVQLHPGVVIDRARSVQSPLYVVPSWESHAITSVMEAEEIPVILPDPVGMKALAEPIEGISRSQLMSSSAQSQIIVETKDGKAVEDSAKNLPGPATLGFAVERKLADGKTARAVVIGDADFATNVALAAFGQGNLLFAENVISWASGARKDLGIGPKDARYAVVGPDLTDSGALWILFSTALAMPATILSTGVFVWVRRRGR